jgi:glycosyltransferase involved in cell wall biosynthesis
MSAPAVSVIVPCHNGGRFLDGLLASLAAQTFRDFEIVIVDNGSTEPATQQKLAALESVVRVIHQENRYLPGARNTGFREARAEFILPLDCDDTLDPSFLAQAYALLRDAPPDVGFVFPHIRLTGWLEGVLPRHFNHFDQLFLNQLPYCMLIRKSAWQKVDGYDEAMRNGTEDWEFNVRLSRAGYRGIEIPRALFNYCVRPDGMLISHSSRLHGTIWRHIRTKHAATYRPATLFSIWRSTRDGGRRISLATAAALLLSAKLLPEALFNSIFHRLHSMARARRIKRGELRSVPQRDRPVAESGLRPAFEDVGTPYIHEPQTHEPAKERDKRPSDVRDSSRH